MSYAVADLMSYCGFKVARECWNDKTYVTSIKNCFGTRRPTLFRDGYTSTYAPTESDMMANDWIIYKEVDEEC